MVRRLLKAFGHLISPDVCRVCGQTLTFKEEMLCLKCHLDIPRTGIHCSDFNEIHQRLGHHAQVDRAAGWFYYKKRTPYAQLLIDSKYNSLPRIDYILGRDCAAELKDDGFFEGVDVLVPMPMYWWKRLCRGYNQACEIARGVSEATGIEVCEALLSPRSHGVQSRLGRRLRYSGISHTMTLAAGATISGKHVLLVDDIITTGASMMEAIRAIWQGHPARVSVLALGMAMLD